MREHLHGVIKSEKSNQLVPHIKENLNASIEYVMFKFFRFRDPNHVLDQAVSFLRFQVVPVNQ